MSWNACMHAWMTNKRTNERTNEWMNEWMMQEWMNLPLNWCNQHLDHILMETLLELSHMNRAELNWTTLCFKTCKTYVPVQLCTTKLAQSTSQYYFVLQSVHIVLPSTTSYNKTCTKYLPVLSSVLQSLHKVRTAQHISALLCTTKRTQGSSQCYFVLQSLHTVLPSTMHYKACTKMRKVRPSTTLHCKACTKNIPILPTLYCKACTLQFATKYCQTPYNYTAHTLKRHQRAEHSEHPATMFAIAGTRAAPISTPDALASLPPHCDLPPNSSDVMPEVMVRLRWCSGNVNYIMIEGCSAKVM